MDIDSPLTREAIAYTWRQLLTRAGADPDDPPLRLVYAASQGPTSTVELCIHPCAPAAWGDLLTSAPLSLRWVAASDALPPGVHMLFGEAIPVIFWSSDADPDHTPFATITADGSVVFYADIIAATFFMLTRWEESVVPTRDAHVRFPATASLSHRQGFLDWPVVDMYALILRAWIQVLVPGWHPQRRQFAVKLSHDIDLLRSRPSPRLTIKRLVADIRDQHDITWIKSAGLDYILDMMGERTSPYLLGVYQLAGLTRKYGMESAFYMMAASPGIPDNDYDLDSPLVRCCIADLQRRGFEMGFHPSYHTLNNPARLAAEKARLDALLGSTHYGGRQHFLRFEAPFTWQHWEQVGLTYDSTLGYADYEGFRCGTCHPFRPFDVTLNRELHLEEWPLIVMDGTLYRYRRLEPQQGQARMLELAQRCRQVEGVFTLLWHNSSLCGDWRPWVDTYEQTLERLASL